MNYDIGGHVLQSAAPLGQTSTFRYNALGQPTSASFPAIGAAGAETVSYLYDGNGRSHSVTDNRGVTSMSCDLCSDNTLWWCLPPRSSEPGFAKRWLDVVGKRLAMSYRSPWQA